MRTKAEKNNLVRTGSAIALHQFNKTLREGTSANFEDRRKESATQRELGSMMNARMLSLQNRADSIHQQAAQRGVALSQRGKTDSHSVLQGVITLNDQPKLPTKKLSFVTLAMLEIRYDASRGAREILASEAIAKEIYNYDSWADAVQQAEGKATILRRKAMLNRIRRTYKRNRKSKARPKALRFLREFQSKYSYGYDHPNISVKSVKGKFRRGWGSQPFLTLKKKHYREAVVPTDYDALIKIFENDKKHTQQEIAEDIIVFIDDGTYNNKDYSPQTDRAISTIVQLTQFIEPHVRRFPGSDKLARACLTRILNGESTFREEFNRKNGNYLPARAKKSGSKFGGQEGMRALMGVKKKKTDKVGEHHPEIEKAIDSFMENLSDSSEEESEEEND